MKKSKAAKAAGATAKQVSGASIGLSGDVPRVYYAVTLLFIWPDDWPGPRIYTAALTGPGHVHSAGFLPLFNTEQEARDVAARYPGAQVFPVPILAVLCAPEQLEQEKKRQQ